MEPFKNTRKCKNMVLIEMTLSGLTLIIFILLLVGMILHLSQDSSFLDLLEESTQPVEEVIMFILRMVVLTHLTVLSLVIVAGYNVLSKACSITSNETDWERLNLGVTACKLFCRLEAFRMILIVITFMGELSIFNLSIVLELVRNVFNVPVLFGWFFASELQKELELRKQEVANSNSFIGTLSINFADCQNESQSMHYHSDISNSCSVSRDHHPQHSGSMNTSPAVAYFLSNSHACGPVNNRTE